MIKSFRHKGLKRFFETGDQRGIPAQFANRIRRQLDVINAAKIIDDIDLPGFELHELKGSRKGTWSIKVSGNWRITFEFRNGDAYNVDLEDYH
jgi:toxin HigB-1